MMCGTEHNHGGTDPPSGPTAAPGEDGGRDRVAFPALLEDSVEDLYEHAPCGYLSTLMDGQIAKINATLLGWLGYTREQLVGRRRFADLLTVGGKIYHETHFAPLLHMQGEVNGVALELRAADDSRLPVLVTSQVKTSGDGEPLLIRTTVFDARDRRAYEQELLRARQDADQAREDADRAREAADRAREQADRERERVQHLASTLQRSLLPPTLAVVPGVEVAAHYHPASTDEVGGDFYDLFPLGANLWAFFLGDVCGKGAAAAAVTSLTRYTLRSATAFDPEPAAVLGNLNAVLQQQFGSDNPQFCTVLFGLLTLDDGGCTITLAGGGHPPALLLRADGTVDYQHLPGGQLIGVLPDPRISTARLRLGPGDTLLLYSDGLIEVRATTDHTEYDEQTLRDFALGLAPTTAAHLMTALTGLLAEFGAGLRDDVAALALSVPTPEANS